MRITKVCVSVLLRNDHKVQDIIAHIFHKIQEKLQKYLVFIDFFNKEMYNKCNVEQYCVNNVNDTVCNCVTINVVKLYNLFTILSTIN